MNGWARRHQDVLLHDLAAGEALLAACRVAVSRYAPRTGFPAPGRIFVVGISDRRLLLWRASKWTGQPNSLASAVLLDQVSSIRFVRSGLFARQLEIALTTGPMTLLESLWGGRLSTLETVFGALHRR